MWIFVANIEIDAPYNKRAMHLIHYIVNSEIH